MKQIQASELILNRDGSIYHLHLKPEHIADTIILVGDPHRVEMVSKFFDSIEIKVQNREFITHTGHLNNKPNDHHSPASHPKFRQTVRSVAAPYQ